MYTTPSICNPVACPSPAAAAPLSSSSHIPRTITASILHHTTVAAGNYR